MSTAETLDAAALLRDLIRIPSVSALSNRGVLRLATDVLGAHRWHLRELSYRDANGVEKVNLIATPPWQPANDFSVDLAFLCHTDTVPFDPAWTAALEPAERDGALHGCGACDVKGFLASLLAAFAPITRAECACTLALVLTADEEIGCVGAKHLLASGLLQAGNVVIGEPTSLHPARAGKGYGLAEIRVLGEQAHSAHPAQGVSAITGAARMIVRIEQLAQSLRAQASLESGIFDPPYTTVNVGTISGGTAKNVVPGLCSFQLEWRPLPSEPDRVIETVRRIAAEMESADPGFHCDIEVLRQQSGFETGAASELVRRWRAISGRSSIAVPFSTEAPLMTALTRNVIVVGPGDMRTAHSPRECVPLSELHQCVRCLRELPVLPLENS